MKDTLFDLWSGKISPWSDNFIRGYEEKRLYCDLEEKRDRLKGLIGEKENKVLDELESTHM